MRIYYMHANSNYLQYLNLCMRIYYMHAKVFKEVYYLKNMVWTKPIYNRTKVDNAGHILTNKEVSQEDIENALTVLNNWRSSHGYPMNTFQARLRQMSKKVDDNALVVQRLKRVPSIINKLI